MEDVTARAEALPWEALEPRQKYRLEGQALWIRFQAAVPPDSRWFLVLVHPSADLIQLAYRRSDGRWVNQSAGQTLPVKDTAFPGRLPTFELAPPSAGMVDYWLRIERDRAHFSTPLQFFSQPTLLGKGAVGQFTLGAYLGMLVFLIAISIVSAVGYRDRNFAAFVVFLIGIGAVQLVYLGVGAQHVWTESPHWNAIARLIVPGCASAACLWFIKTLSEPARFSRTLDLACGGLIMALLAATALHATIATRGSLLLVTGLIGAALPLTGVLLWTAWRVGRDRHMGIIALAFVPLCLGALLPILYLLNLAPESVLTRHGLTLGTAIQLPLTYFALSRWALDRRETGRRAAQLTHADALTGLWNRQTLLRRLGESLHRAIGQRHQCAVLAVRLTNLEVLENELGHATAERALVVAASILRAAASDIDAAGRIGEQDFVLLLEGPTSGQVAVARAQQIVAQGLQHASVLPPATTLKFHVAVTMLPDQELDPARCLRWLEDACDAMRADPRRAIRTLNF